MQGSFRLETMEEEEAEATYYSLVSAGGSEQLRLVRWWSNCIERRAATTFFLLLFPSCQKLSADPWAIYALVALIGSIRPNNGERRKERKKEIYLYPNGLVVFPERERLTGNNQQPAAAKTKKGKEKKRRRRSPIAQYIRGASFISDETNERRYIHTRDVK